MWHSEIPIIQHGHSFTHADKILAMGSCFADEMGNRLAVLQFDTLVNPFGVLYNPISHRSMFWAPEWAEILGGGRLF